MAGDSTVKVVYTGAKDWESDVWTGSGAVWRFRGEAVDLPVDKAEKLVRMLPTEFRLDEPVEYSAMDRGRLRTLLEGRTGQDVPATWKADKLIKELQALDAATEQQAA